MTDSSAALRLERTLPPRSRIRPPRALTIPGRGAIGFAMLAVVVAFTALGPWLTPFEPNALFQGPRLASVSARHPLGTDLLGRDYLSRVLVGGRSSLGIAVAVLAMTLVAGIGIGGAAGYIGGAVDQVFSLATTMFQALPEISFTIAIVAVVGPGPSSLILALTITSWVGYARLFRGAVIVTRGAQYVEAARATGCGTWRILIRHLTPNVARPILALACLQLSGVMFNIAALSFLGLGIQPPTADWGTMINDARPFLRTSPLLALAPCACIALVSIGANLVGDALLTGKSRTSAISKRSSKE